MASPLCTRDDGGMGTDSGLSHTDWNVDSELPSREKRARRVGAPLAGSAQDVEEEVQMRVSLSRRNPFKFLFGTTRREQYVERYVLREHKKGRALAAILDDPYVRAWSTAQERKRLLERPGVVAAIGEQVIADLRAAVAAGRGVGADTTRGGMVRGGRDR